MDKPKKPTLLSIRQHTSISTQQLAHEAGVSITETYVVEIGGFVSRETAQKVIMAFSRLSGIHYSLDDIQFRNVGMVNSRRSSTISSKPQ